MSKKRAPKSIFHSPAGSSFAQKKKVVFGNIKHSGNEKDISLNKSGLGDSVYFDVNSLSGDDKNVGMTGVNSGSLLGLATITPKAKHINTSTVFGFPLGSSNFDMNDNKKVKVSVRQLFALDINLLAVKGKLVMAKTQFVRKNFLSVNGFGEATTPSKFEGIIRSIFTSESNMEKAVLLAKEKGIVINTDLKRQGICSDQAVVIKEIFINTPKNMIVAALAKFGEIKSIKIQLIGKNSVHMAMAVSNCETWALRNKFRALLFTLPVGTTAHNLGTLLDGAGEKTCVYCAVVGFESEVDLESAYHTELIFGGVKLFWARLDLGVSISKPAAFSGKSWAYVVLLASPFSGSHFDSGFGSGLPLSGFSSIKESALVVQNKFSINSCLASLEHSLELLTDQMSNIVCRLNSIKLVFLVLTTQVILLVTLVSILALPDTDMVLDVPQLFFSLFSSVLEDKVVDLDLSSSKVLTLKVGGLESKIMALELIWKVATCNIRSMLNLVKQEDIVHWHKDLGNMILIVTKTKLKSDIRPWIMNKFDRLRVFTSGLDVGFCGAGVAIIMNNSLAQHVLKVNEILSCLIFVHLLFKNKLSVKILGLYIAANINSMVSKAVNSSSFVVLGGNFNENGSSKSANFKFCLSLGLVNIFNGHSLAKAFTWSNSRGVKKVINFILVSENLVSAMALHFVNSISKFFDTDYKSVFISIGLGGLLDTHLISIHRQVNQDWWKFKFKDADNVQWLSFKDCSSATFLARLDIFKETKINGDLNTMWKILKEIIVQAADTLAIDVVEASKVNGMVLNGVSSIKLIKHLSVIRKGYCKFKYCESKIAEDTAIRKTIDCHIENFYSDKEKMIKSILEYLFCKMVLDHLVVDDELIIEPNEIKFKYCGGEVLACLLKLLNLCLSMSAISDLWKEAWVSIIPKPYEWNGVLTNTKSIALIKTARKILSKILSDWISLACSKFNVLCNDNFLVLKDTLTQSPIFAIGSIVKDALEKNRELWLVL
ncbi:hypothetical protein G9A89_005876 [Geosiphon pyriformis]|nr:hypothetical protein G9A89_005876 [Geosiphon pyriformis]